MDLPSITVSGPSPGSTFVTGASIAVTWSGTYLSSSYVKLYVCTSSSLVKCVSASSCTLWDSQETNDGSFTSTVSDAYFTIGANYICVADYGDSDTFAYGASFTRGA